jgi:transposase
MAGEDPVRKIAKIRTSAPAKSSFVEDGGKAMARRRQGKAIVKLAAQLEQINLKAGGIDVGSDRHMVAVPQEGNAESVREFGAFTEDLREMGRWLKSCGVTTVAMESTGVYWIPVFETLEGMGLEVKLVDARSVKNVSGRKSDVLDCQWLQQLHTFGLLKGAFRPADEICVIRGYMRQRQMLVQSKTMHILHMQKALQQMNVLLHKVVTDITGKTGMAIMKEILSGERNPQKLAKNRDERCQSSEETIAKSLVGNYREEHLFALRQAISLYETFQEKERECEEALMRYVASRPKVTEEGPPPGQGNSGKKARERMRGGVDVREQLYKMTGVDLFNVPGLGADTLLTILGEVGTDVSKWETEKHFSSWLALCPGTDISGGKVLSKRSRRSANRASAAFRIAASTLSSSKTALGAFYRRIKGRKGPAQAVTATAHKIAVIFYSMLKYGTEYVEAGQAAYEEKYQSRRLKAIKHQALALGYQLFPVE